MRFLLQNPQSRAFRLLRLNCAGVTITAVAVFVASIGRICRADENSGRLQKVIAAWTERSRTPDRVSYQLVGTATYLPGSLVAPGSFGMPSVEDEPDGFPPKETKINVKARWLFDFKNNFFRKDSHEKMFQISLKTFVPLVRVDVFNGREIKGWRPRKENAGPGYGLAEEESEVWIARSDDTSSFFNYADMPVLFAHGLQELRSSQPHGVCLAEMPNLMVNDGVAESEPGVVVVSWKKHHKTTWKPVEEEHRYWVDLNRGGAVLRWEMLGNSTLSFRVVTEWKQYRDIWLPLKWDSQTFRGMVPGDEKLVSMLHWNVDHVDIDLDFKPEEFEIPYAPGMLIQREEDNARWRVASDGKTLEPSPLQDNSKPKSSVKPTNYRWYGFGCIIAGIVLIVLFVRLRST